MCLKLNKYWSDKLVQMPETGMGYQRVDLVLKDGRTIKQVLVLNGQEFQTDQDFKVEDIIDITICKT